MQLKCGLTYQLIPVVIQINGCLLMFCHEWRDNFLAPNATITFWRRALPRPAGGADNASQTPLAGYRGDPREGNGRKRGKGEG